MATLEVADLLELLDSVAAQVATFEDALGVDGSAAESVAEGAANNQALVTSALERGADVVPLLIEVTRRAALVVAGRLYRTLEGERLQAALDAHYGGTGGLNRVLAAADVRVHPDVRKIGIQIDARVAFLPTVQTLASVAVTGAGAGTVTPGTPIDRSVYGKANCVVRATTAIGAAAIVATLSMTTIDGATVPVVVTIPALSADDTTIDVGTHGTDMFVACTAVAFTGGAASEGFDVRTKIERAVAL